MSGQTSLDKKKDVKLKLLRTISLMQEKDNRLEHTFFPSLGMGIVFSQLKTHGYNVSQDDLSMRLHYDHYDKSVDKKYNCGLFFQKERIIAYTKSGEDPELEQEISRILENTDIEDIDIFLLSIPESLSNPSNILFAIAFSKWLKKRFTSWIVVGGHSFSVMLLVNEYDVNGLVDYIVVEDGEEAVLNVIAEIISQNPRNCKPKVIRKQTDQIVVPDFSGLPIAKYSLSFLDYTDFSSNPILKDFFVANTLILPFQFIKGCPNQCAFCGSSSERLRSFISVQEVTSAIKTLQDKFAPLGYLFLNDTINFSKSYIQSLCDMICNEKIKILWSDCARVNGLDERLIARMRESGCIRLILGMETASPNLLRRVRKGITLSDLENALRLATKYGIWTGVEIICGLPHEREEDVDMTIGFLTRNKDYIDRIYCNIFDLRDRSLMRLNPSDYGIENIQELNLYSNRDPDSFNQGNFVRFSFDETNGLKWEEKKKQMVRSYQRLVNATGALIKLPHHLDEHILFYLYSRCGDKNAVKKQYAELINCFS